MLNAKWKCITIWSRRRIIHPAILRSQYTAKSNLLGIRCHDVNCHLKGDQGLPGEQGATGDRGVGEPGPKVRQCADFTTRLNEESVNPIVSDNAQRDCYRESQEQLVWGASLDSQERTEHQDKKQEPHDAICDH